ncbi:MAG: peptide chain release factor 1 [Planctomycetes bacterium]|nr:peptide chain release factor 1 [Planctomycetota bacterium]
MPDLLASLESLSQRYAQITEMLGDAAIVGSSRYLGLMREHARLGRLMDPYMRLRKAEGDASAARSLLADPDMKEMAREEVATNERVAAGLLDEIKLMLVQSDEAGSRDAILEIRAGTGGDEAALFAGDLARMYSMWVPKHGIRLEPISLNEGEKGGFKEAVFLARTVGQARGLGAFGLLRYESGGHRVQRVPETEAQGRIHTSACTVAVMPEAEEVDVTIRPDDLRIDVFRAGGAGGQHVNKTESAVRITHIPTGVVVSCQDEKSQISNRERAMKVLRSRLYEAERERQERERSALRKEQVGSGDRSDRIRTYNFPQNRITDHRINWTGYSLDRFVQGHCDELYEMMMESEKEKFLERWDGTF